MHAVARALVLATFVVGLNPASGLAQYRATLLPRASLAADEPVPLPALHISCPARRVGALLLNTAGGAALGWFLFTFGVGLLADDHGAAYRTERRRFVAVGAIAGAGVGLLHAIADDCMDLPIRHQPRRRPDADDQRAASAGSRMLNVAPVPATGAESTMM